VSKEWREMESWRRPQSAVLAAAMEAPSADCTGRAAIQYRVAMVAGEVVGRRRRQRAELRFGEVDWISISSSSSCWRIEMDEWIGKKTTTTWPRGHTHTRDVGGARLSVTSSSPCTDRF
jgi:hypothetical protein